MAALSSLFSSIRAPLNTGVNASIQRGFKFKHIVTPGNPQLQWRTATGPVRGHINAAPRANFSTAVRKPSPGESPTVSRLKIGGLGRVALGAALGVSTVTLGQFFHRGTMAAMDLPVNLDSSAGDWTVAKGFLLSLSVTDRHQYYKTKHVTLKEIPVWTPSAASLGSGESLYPRNAKLDGKISVHMGDITTLEIDAIVNAANKTLLGGGGVDGAIHRAAGPMLKNECISLRGCETGEAKITCGYCLPAKYVIHTVGPVAHNGVGEVEKKALRSCYKNSLQQATENSARSVAFPCISTGIYGYPPEQAVLEALATVREYLDEHYDKLDRVIFCVFSPVDMELYLHNLPLYFPAAPPETLMKSKL
ncbi:ADP-ribose glycohydrolase MACROD1 [Aulostomus maculatus]